MLANILRSLAITAAVSGAIAFFLTTFSISFWKSFLLVTVVQVMAWRGYQYWVDVKAAIRNKELEERMLKDYAMQSISMPCAYCKVDNFVPVRFDQVNKFDCTECNKTNAVYVDVETARITEPVENLKVSDVLKVNADV